VKRRKKRAVRAKRKKRTVRGEYGDQLAWFY